MSFEKAVHASSWQGSRLLVNSDKNRRFAWWYLAEYRIRHMRKWVTAILIFGIGNPILYLFSIGLGIGALVDANSGGAGVDGVPYLTFLAPALLASAAIQGAQDETVFPVMQGFIWDKGFFAVNSTPVSSRDIVHGVLTAALIRTLITTAIYELVLLGFGGVTLANMLPMYVTAILAAMAYSCVMVGMAGYASENGSFMEVVQRLIIFPMFMFSGTFYPIETTPIYLQWFGWISPLWHATDLSRAISYGHTIEPWVLVVHIAYLALWAVVGLAIAYPKFAKRLSA